VTLTATVAPSGGTGNPTGVVDFYAASVKLGSATLDATGRASITGSNFALGATALTAVYQGDATNHTSTSAAVTETVSPADTKMTLVASTASLVAGQSVKLTATLASHAPGAATPAGVIVFTDGATVLGTVVVDPNGHGSITTALTRAGTHAIVATFYGGSNFLGSTSAAATTTVTPAAATHFRVDGLGQTVAGKAVSATVSALDAFGNVATGYTGKIHFASSDKKATLPADLTFSAASQGVVTVSLTFATAGAQTLTVTDAANASIATSLPLVVGAGSSSGGSGGAAHNDQRPQ
jgi:hypothetical protein